MPTRVTAQRTFSDPTIHLWITHDDTDAARKANEEGLARLAEKLRDAIDERTDRDGLSSWSDLFDPQYTTSIPKHLEAVRFLDMIDECESPTMPFFAIMRHGPVDVCIAKRIEGSIRIQTIQMKYSSQDRWSQIFIELGLICMAGPIPIDLLLVIPISESFNTTCIHIVPWGTIARACDPNNF